MALFSKSEKAAFKKAGALGGSASKGGGKSQRGSKNPNSKLTDKKALEIYNAKGIKIKDLATKYGVTKSVIVDIRGGRSWKHVTSK